MNSSERIEHEASRWLAAQDSSDTTVQGDFQHWLESDIRHRVAFLRLRASWERMDKLRTLRPLDRSVNPDLFKERSFRKTAPLAIAASVVLALVVAGLWFAASDLGWQRYETRVGGFSRVVLEDGSVVDLNTNSEIRVRVDSKRREVRLLRGESRFKVAHDASRPFTVSAADAAVRALGTAFTVRVHQSARVDVLVSEGKVAITSARLAHTPPLQAGDAAVVLPDRVSVSHVEPKQIESRLAWTGGRLQFRGETLASAITEFNRYNRRQLQLADPALGELRVGGNFAATDPDSFAAALASAFKLRISGANTDAIVLEPP